MSADTDFVIGYGGYCRLFSGRAASSSSLSYTVFPMTSGNYSQTTEAQMDKTFAAWYDESVRTPMQTGWPVHSWNGSLNFEYTPDIVDIVFGNNLSFFNRTHQFTIQMSDGEKYVETDGVWSGVSLQSTANELVTGGIQFSSCNRYVDHIVTHDNSGSQLIGDYPTLQPYWNYGADGITDFTLSISRNVTPVYLNEPNWSGPSYLRVGLMEASASVTCWKEWEHHWTLRLGPKIIHFNSASFVSDSAYAFSDSTGESAKTYTMSLSALKSTERLFTIQ